MKINISLIRNRSYSDQNSIFQIENHQNSEFTFQSKVMMKKLLKMTEIATLPKGA